MKWFKHDCTAMHDPRMQRLGSTLGLEGVAVYWGLLEAIGHLSDTFHLRITGVNEEADRHFGLVRNKPPIARRFFGRTVPASAALPYYPLDLMANNYFTTPAKILAVISAAVELELFDRDKWCRWSILYSRMFEKQADEYTSRRKRAATPKRRPPQDKPERIPRGSGHAPENVPKMFAAGTDLSGECPSRSDESRSEEKETDKNRQDEIRQDQDKTGQDKISPDKTRPDKTGKDQIRPEKKSFSKDLSHYAVDNLPARSVKNFSVHSVKNLSAPSVHNLSARSVHNAEVPIDEFDSYLLRCVSLVVKWNQEHTPRVDWVPTPAQVRKLLNAGTARQRDKVVRLASEIHLRHFSFEGLVLRAIRLMLRANARHRIARPFSWIWCCLLGRGDGGIPWVHLLTSHEESRRMQRRRDDDDFGPAFAW